MFIIGVNNHETQINSNMTELTLNNGTVVLFSYETPVAAKRLVDKYNIPDETGEYYQYIKTNKNGQLLPPDT